jgi:hypothetical protein
MWRRPGTPGSCLRHHGAATPFLGQLCLALFSCWQIKMDVLPCQRLLEAASPCSREGRPGFRCLCTANPCTFVLYQRACSRSFCSPCPFRFLCLSLLPRVYVFIFILSLFEVSILPCCRFSLYKSSLQSVWLGPQSPSFWPLKTTTDTRRLESFVLKTQSPPRYSFSSFQVDPRPFYIRQCALERHLFNRQTASLRHYCSRKRRIYQDLRF